MGFNDDLKRRKDGSYILSHKTKKGKSRDLLYKYNTEDMQMVRNHIEDNLRKYSSHSTMKPIWCKKCAALIEYRIKVKHEKNN